MSISNVQASEWITRLKGNLSQLEAHSDPLSFLSEQYFLLSLLSQALDGTVVFVGAPVIHDDDD